MWIDPIVTYEHTVRFKSMLFIPANSIRFEEYKCKDSTCGVQEGELRCTGRFHELYTGPGRGVHHTLTLSIHFRLYQFSFNLLSPVFCIITSPYNNCSLS